jgi:hypothetical protein
MLFIESRTRPAAMFRYLLLKNGQFLRSHIRSIYIVFFSFLGWGETEPLIGLLYQPRMIDDECGAVGGMKIGRGNRIAQKKPTPMPLCPPQIPHDLTWTRTRTAAVGSRRLTALAMAQPSIYV